MRWASASIALLLAACPRPPDPDPCDGGPCPLPPTACDAGTMLTATNACAPVGWTSCPAGFTADPSGWGCAPIIAAGPCDAGTAPRLGEPGCVPIGWTNCTAGFAPADGGWGCDPVLPPTACSGATREALGLDTCVPIGDCSDAGFPPAGATLFVDDSFTAVDATHFRTISEALVAALPGATIAVESGTYSEALAPNRPVNLIGRCPAQVRLTTDGGTAAITVLGPHQVGVENLTISGALLAMRLEAGARVTARRLVIDGNRRSAVQVVDPATQLTLEESVIRNTLPDPGTNTFGQGLAASFGAQLSLTDVAIVGNREVGVFIDRMPTHLEGRRLLVLSTLPRMSTNRLGWGIAVQGGATLDAFGVAVAGNTGAGVLVTQANSRLALTDFVIQGTKVGKDNANADVSVQAAAQLGGRLQLQSGAISDGVQLGLDVDGANSQATLTNVTIRGLSGAGAATRAIEVSSSGRLTANGLAVVRIGAEGLTAIDGNVTIDDAVFSELAGPGIRSQLSSVVTASDLTVDRASAAGLVAITGGRLSASSCAVLGTRLGNAGTATQTGYGAISQDGASATLDRCLFDGNQLAGLYASGGALAAKSTIVRGTLPSDAGEYGQGAVAENGGTLTLEGLLFDRNRAAGLQSSNAPSAITASDLIVRDTLPDGTMRRGRGANAQFGGTLSVTRGAFLGNRQVGVFSFGSRVTLDDVLVLGTLADPDGAYGNGIEALTDGDIVMTRGAIESSAGIGAVFAEGAGLLDGVRIGRNAVGLHTQDGVSLLEVESAPAMRGPRDLAVTRSTVFDENATKLGSGTVPLPMP